MNKVLDKKWKSGMKKKSERTTRVVVAQLKKWEKCREEETEVLT